ncbi:MAG: imidazolonepropionase [Bacteroidia bacterium]
MYKLIGIKRLYTGKMEDPLEDATLVWQGEEVLWVGPARDLPSAFRNAFPYDARGKIVLPGLVDCHTHLAFGGWRVEDFVLRCQGLSYVEVGQRGGGILYTVAQTRRASEKELLDKAYAILRQMLSLGIVAVEAKSGYGLSLPDEIKILRVYQQLRSATDIEIVPTFLGAHAVPKEFSSEAYVKHVIEDMLPAVARERLAEFCDVFVEEGAFTAWEARAILTAAQAWGLRVKLHVDQLHDSGGGQLAAELKAISADHLEYTSWAGIQALAQSQTVAVMLPFASLYLRQKPMEARKFRDAGVEVAVATDFNPGSAPSWHLPAAMSLACIMGGLTPQEALVGATYLAAKAIGREKTLGTLEPGKKAHFLLVEAESVESWLYLFPPAPPAEVFLAGKPVENRVC